MNNMINIAEILKDAPKGIKLYSLIHGDVTLESVDTAQEYYPIDIIANQSDCTDTLSKDGKIYYDYVDAECVLFPSKEHKSWDNWQDILFQCGDVVVSNLRSQTYLFYGNSDRGYLAYGVDGCNNYITPSYYRYATPEEREQFFKELENNGYYWNENTKQMEKSLQQDKHKDCLDCVATETKEEPFIIDQLKPFDKVLVQDLSSHWTCDFYIRYDNTHKLYACITSTWDKCIPYNDETKHLLGTTDNAPDKYKTW